MPYLRVLALVGSALLSTSAWSFDIKTFGEDRPPAAKGADATVISGPGSPGAHGVPGQHAGSVNATLGVNGGRAYIQGKDKPPYFIDSSSNEKINIDAHGGRGGDGGQGGTGAIGHVGAQGNSNPMGPGQQGGKGGQGGPGGPGGNAGPGGNGGNIMITTRISSNPAYDETMALLRLGKINIAPGAAGNRGPKGKGGPGGPGGLGGQGGIMMVPQQISDGQGGYRMHMRPIPQPDGGQGAMGERGVEGSLGAPANPGNEGSFVIHLKDDSGQVVAIKQSDIFHWQPQFKIVEEIADSVLEPGERGYMLISFTNTGNIKTPAQSGRVRITSDDQSLDINKDYTEAFFRGNIGPQETVACMGAAHNPEGQIHFQVPLRSEANSREFNGHANFTLTWMLDAMPGIQFSQSFTVNLQYPVAQLPIRGVTTVSPKGDGLMKATAVNLSQLPVSTEQRHVTLSFKPHENGLLFIDREGNYMPTGVDNILAQIAVGATGLFPFTIKFNQDCPKFCRRTFDVVLSIKHPSEPSMIKVQTQSFEVGLGEAYSYDENAKALLVIHDKTTQKEVETWSKLLSEVGYPVNVWHLGMHKSIDFEMTLPWTNSSLRQDFANGLIVVLNDHKDETKIPAGQLERLRQVGIRILFVGDLGHNAGNIRFSVAEQDFDNVGDFSRLKKGDWGLAAWRDGLHAAVEGPSGCMALSVESYLQEKSEELHLTLRKKFPAERFVVVYDTKASGGPKPYRIAAYSLDRNGQRYVSDYPNPKGDDARRQIVRLLSFQEIYALFQNSGSAWQEAAHQELLSQLAAEMQENLFKKWNHSFGSEQLKKHLTKHQELLSLGQKGQTSNSMVLAADLIAAYQGSRGIKSKIFSTRHRAKIVKVACGILTEYAKGAFDKDGQHFETTLKSEVQSHSYHDWQAARRQLLSWIRGGRSKEDFEGGVYSKKEFEKLKRSYEDSRRPMTLQFVTDVYSDLKTRQEAMDAF